MVAVVAVSAVATVTAPAAVVAATAVAVSQIRQPKMISGQTVTAASPLK